jgi:short-subunit dehydrogenase
VLSINPELKVKVVPIDLAKATDYSPITGDREVMENLGVLVNNAGVMVRRNFFEQDPE